MVAIIATAQVVLAAVTGMGWAGVARQLRKLFVFLAVIQVAYSLVTNDPATDEWIELSLLGLGVDINLGGALMGATMVLRVIAVVLASHVARAGDARALAHGLRGLGVPKKAALAIDAVLVLLGDSPNLGRGGGRGRGGGGGGGGGGGRGNGGGPETSFRDSLRRLARGDVSIIADSLRRNVARAEEHAAAAGGDREMARDVAIIAGIALTMIGIKMLKLLPGIPFAPGHKGVILIPLYITAGFMTRSRTGSTLTGLTMGTVAFLLGDGRYGVFEIAKHVAPGIVVDLFGPLVQRKTRGPLAWSLFGLVIALGRYATVTVIAFAVQAPAVVYAVLIPGLIVHAIFGVLSGLVTAPLVRSLLRDSEGPPPPGPTSSDSTA